MCCRFYTERETVLDRLEELGISGKPSAESFPGGIITPGSKSVMIAGQEKQMIAPAATWGFPAKDKKMIINARSETAADRPMFSDAMGTRRCLLPAECFYEWDRNRKKVTFYSENKPLIYLAGLWSLYNGEARFVVLTTAANESMLPVHDRMPLMVDSGSVEAWLYDRAFALKYLRAEMPRLRLERECEQMSLL